MSKPDSRSHQTLVALLERDGAWVSTPDYTTPFKGLDDALDRLLPYHMLAGENPAEADAEAAAGASRGILAAPRSEVWRAQLAARALDLHAMQHALDGRVTAAEKALLTKSELPALMLQSYATAEAQAQVQAELRLRQAADEAARAMARGDAAPAPVPPPGAAAGPAQAPAVAGAPGGAQDAQRAAPLGAAPAAPVQPPHVQAQQAGSALGSQPAQAQATAAPPQMPAASRAGPPGSTAGAPAEPGPSAGTPAAQPAAGPASQAPSNPALEKQRALAALAARIKQSARR
ncbi:hypothetical protein ACKKBG_A13870 [Auxenochlorella protothecoides x Auxenochlorella symbiontica]